MELESEGLIIGVWDDEESDLFHPILRVDEGWIHINAVGGDWIPVAELSRFGIADAETETD